MVSYKLLHALIAKMYVKMNHIIQMYNYDLLADEVQSYSRRIDKVLIYYNRKIERQGTHKSVRK